MNSFQLSPEGEVNSGGHIIPRREAPTEVFIYLAL